MEVNETRVQITELNEFGIWFRKCKLVGYDDETELCHIIVTDSNFGQTKTYDWQISRNFYIEDWYESEWSAVFNRYRKRVKELLFNIEKPNSYAEDICFNELNICRKWFKGGFEK